MRLSWLLIARLLAGCVGFAPPFLAASLLDGLTYGLGASSFAVGLLAVGPVSQYAKQGYLRSLLLSDRPDISAQHIMTVFVIIVATVGAISCLLGYSSATSVASVLIASATLAAARLEEVRQVAANRQLAAVVLFYVIPPLFISLIFILLWFFDYSPNWWMVSGGMSLSYLLPSIYSIVSRRGFIFRFSPIPRLSNLNMIWCESRTFLFSGFIMSASESLPTLSLAGLNQVDSIAVFELLRKLSSAVSVFLHGLSIAFSPSIIRAAADKDWFGVKKLIGKNAKISLAFALLYLPAAVLVVLLMERSHRLHGEVSLGIALPLFLSSFITCVAAPFGMAVAAINSERWWIIGGGLGLLSFLMTLCAAPFTGAGVAVSLAVLAQNAVLSFTIGVVVVGRIYGDPNRPRRFSNLFRCR